jgi:hypothetical protein
VSGEESNSLEPMKALGTGQHCSEYRAADSDIDLLTCRLSGSWPFPETIRRLRSDRQSQAAKNSLATDFRCFMSRCNRVKVTD